MSVRAITRAAVFAGVVAVVVLGAGCSGGGSGATKAGKTSGPVVLRMASRDSDPTFDLAAALFVRRVTQISSGKLRIDVVPGWGHEQPDVEQQIVRAVAAGKVDLGAVGTRVFDTLGVSSLQALTAPMLIDSYPLERAVIASRIPGQMLRGLGKVGVGGLAILGEGLRKPVATRRPLLGPSDWHGITFAAYRSQAAAASIRALGARPSDVIADALDAALLAHRIEAAENDLLIYQSNARQYRAPYVTANVNLWPRTEVLIANPGRLATLTSTQQRWLRRAAAEAAARSTSLFTHDSQVARALCKSGARFANASRAQLVALRKALRPVYTTLEQDPETKSFIDQIEQIKRSTPTHALAIPAGCDVRAKASTSSAKGNPKVLNGVYRVEWSAKELIDAGAGRTYVDANFGFLDGHDGVVTLRVQNGRFTVEANGAPWSPCPGTYTVTGTTVTLAFQPPNCEGRIIANWLLRNDGLRLRVRRAGVPGDAVIFGAKTWIRIA
jgi:TRAP-type C4-dicarboxylate transport system substrate-binding protein